MFLIVVLAFMVAFWTFSLILWLLLIRKKLEDLRIYVLYGLFHWLMMGQLETLIGYNFYESKQWFDESTHAKAALLIAGSVLFFLLGYSVWTRM